MNIIEKAYCRIFLKVFKLAIPILPYRNPEVITDISYLPSLLAKNKIKKTFIICDSFLKDSPLFSEITTPLEKKWKVF